MDKIINFNPEGMKGLHFYIEGLNFPVAIGTYSDWEEVQVEAVKILVSLESKSF